MRCFFLFFFFFPAERDSHAHTQTKRFFSQSRRSTEAITARVLPAGHPEAAATAAAAADTVAITKPGGSPPHHPEESALHTEARTVPHRSTTLATRALRPQARALQHPTELEAESEVAAVAGTTTAAERTEEIAEIAEATRTGAIAAAGAGSPPGTTAPGTAGEAPL